MSPCISKAEKEFVALENCVGNSPVSMYIHIGGQFPNKLNGCATDFVRPTLTITKVVEANSYPNCLLKKLHRMPSVPMQKTTHFQGKDDIGVIPGDCLGCGKYRVWGKP
uniref:Uncharacterized protein n=1 Tax=Lactuca sativa TaxID=4236 RepID=A0A9R1WFJ8_LACSA|nr:hypothetical protein LSAT_V11C200079220 [Lactuca sativa]